MSSSPSPRVAKKRERVRVQILEAARAQIDRHGIVGLTVEGVAEEAGMSKASVFYYFESKDRLTYALAVDRTREEVQAITTALAGLDAGESVVSAVVRTYVAFHLPSLQNFRASYAWSQMQSTPATEADLEINPLMIGLFSTIEDRLAEDQVRGLLHDGMHLRRVAVGTWTTAQGLVSTLSLLDAGSTQLLHQVDDLVDEVCGMLTRGVYRG